ncbi:hypothetical protein BDU57DRAFT_52789 [Ampelomyces quisqualis]|uniref:Uncharacterized protein n=1 Tax=Ampelomyces quisqualis TaxID=50730 RepID=A0A6A5R425_AMPQU|nr:hypothetical protein BDU57DRAFT_52789 [Ampelomyces quisqualis]
MPTRSGKAFSIASDPPSAKPTSKKKQPVQKTRATAASKRARADSDALPAAPGLQQEREEAPAVKRPRHGPGGLRNAGRSETDDIIDLTLSDHGPQVPTATYGMTWDLPVRRGPEEVHKHPHILQQQKQKHQKTTRRGTGPARVMFTVSEARLRLHGAGKQTADHLIPPYTLRTGEYVPFPVTKSYHLGAMGRYSKAPVRLVAQQTDHDPADYVFDRAVVHCGKRIDEVPRPHVGSTTPSPYPSQLLHERRGLRKALEPRAPHDRCIDGAPKPAQDDVLPSQHQAPTFDAVTGGYGQYAKAHLLPKDMTASVSVPKLDGSIGAKRPLQAEPYTFTFGPYHGQTFYQVPMSYLRSIEHNHALMEKENSLRGAFGRCFPRGCFRYEVENYRFDFGKYITKSMHEVPEAYLADVATNMFQLGKSVVLQHALRCKNQQLGRSNNALDATLKTFYKKKSQSKI